MTQKEEPQPAPGRWRIATLVVYTERRTNCSPTRGLAGLLQQLFRCVLNDDIVLVNGTAPGSRSASSPPTPRLGPADHRRDAHRSRGHRHRRHFNRSPLQGARRLIVHQSTMPILGLNGPAATRPTFDGNGRDSMPTT